jgi:monoamine oxidase
MSKTNLMQFLRVAITKAIAADRQKEMPPQEWLETQQHSRRDFIGNIAKASLAIGLSSLVTTGCQKEMITNPDNDELQADEAGLRRLWPSRIAIIGGGIAGLSCAHALVKKGFASTIYEASSRTGGRMYTAQNILAPGLSTELGGEFIDSIHTDILRLTQEFGLNLLDTNDSINNGLIKEGYFFNNHLYTEAEVISAFETCISQIDADVATLGDGVTYDNPGSAAALDNTSLSDYIQQLNTTAWLKELLTLAYVTEYGLDAGQQSCINFLFLISTDLSNGFQLFGESDQRYKIKGGNQRLVNRLSTLYNIFTRKEHRLIRIKLTNNGRYQLTFQTPGGTEIQTADVVVLALPFTLLREVDIQVPLPAWKTNAIQNLGYGTNAKLMLGFNSRVWNTQGFKGDSFSDESFQSGWDNSELQGGVAGGYTMYFGGTPGVQLANGSAQQQAANHLPGLNKLFPGIQGAFNNNVTRFHWPTHPFTKGSYACYKVGQWTTIAGAEIKPIDNLFFAGEHCSLDFQGFMNGGAETGRRVAHAIAHLL